MIRPVTAADAPAICAIYNHYILNTPITFEETAVDEGEMRSRIADIQADLPWLVFERDGRVAGYAYAGRWRSRSAYRHTAETAVYVDPTAIRSGIGSKLYERLIADLRRHSMHVLMGVIALPNPESVALHEKFGFRRAGHLHEVGRKFDRWLDVGYWELVLK